MNVETLTRGRRTQIAALQRKKARDEAGECVVEGRRSVDAAVHAGATVRELVVTEELLDDPAMDALARAAGRVLVATVKDFQRMSDVTTSQGLLAVVESRWADLTTLSNKKRVVVLDGVQDPGNVGTIIRTAAWFGIDAVVCAPGVADCYGPKVVRASMGSVWDLELIRSESLAADLGEIGSLGFELYAAHLVGRPVDEWRPGPRSCLLLGSEAHGPSDEALSLVATRVRIPRRRRQGVTESLNVGVAAGILMFSWTLVE